MQGPYPCPTCHRPLNPPFGPFCPYCGGSLAPLSGTVASPPPGYAPSPPPSGYPAAAPPAAGPYPQAPYPQPAYAPTGYPQRPPGKGPLLAVVVVVIVVVAIVAVALAAVLLAPRGPGGATFTGFRMSGTGCWTGVFANGGGATTVSDCGARDVALACNQVLVAQVMKEDAGTWTLTVQILHNGAVSWSSSTSSPYGIVQGTALC